MSTTELFACVTVKELEDSMHRSRAQALRSSGSEAVYWNGRAEGIADVIQIHLLREAIYSGAAKA